MKWGFEKYGTVASKIHDNYGNENNNYNEDNNNDEDDDDNEGDGRHLSVCGRR